MDDHRAGEGSRGRCVEVNLRPPNHLRNALQQGPLRVRVGLVSSKGCWRAAARAYGVGIPIQVVAIEIEVIHGKHAARSALLGGLLGRKRSITLGAELPRRSIVLEVDSERGEEANNPFNLVGVEVH